MQNANSCSATGFILRENYSNVAGNNIWENNWSHSSTSTTMLSSFEGPENVADNYASRIHGYICPPQDGNYTFWIAGDDATELYISTDDNKANKRKIAYSLSWTGPREWNKSVTQKSALIYLKGGKKYYIEATHKEGGGGDNIAVGWELPTGLKEMPIPGNRLTPYKGVSEKIMQNLKGDSFISELINHKDQAHYKVIPNPIITTATIYFTLLKTGNTLIELFDLQGRSIKKIFSGRMNAGITQQVILNTDGLIDGSYFIKITSADKVKTLKIIVAR